MKKIFIFLLSVIAFAARSQTLYIPSNPDSLKLPINVSGMVRSVYVKDLIKTTEIQNGAGIAIDSSAPNGVPRYTFKNNLSTGVAGGQIIYGGTGAGENLTLRGTSNLIGGGIIADTLLTGQVKIYNVNDLVNYERSRLFWSSNIFRIGTEASGTGVNRPIQLTAGGKLMTMYPAAGNNVGSGINHIVEFNWSTSGTSGVGINNTFTNPSGISSGLNVVTTYNQSSAGGSRDLWISRYEQALGSGTHYLIDAGTNTAANAGGTHTAKFIVDNTGNVMAANKIGVGSTTAPGAYLHLSSSAVSTSSAFGTNGLGIRQDAATYTSTTSTGTIAATGVNTFAAPTLAASSATTLTTAATVYIGGSPTAGTNVTIGSRYALHIANGDLGIPNGNAFIKAINIGQSSFSTGGMPSTSGVLINSSPSNTVITDAITSASGTVAHGAVHGFGASTIAASNTGITYTNASTIYIGNAPTAGTNVAISNPWALYVNNGKSYFGAGVNTGTPVGGTSATWKLGAAITGQTGLALDATKYVQVDINGTLYKLAVIQ